MKRDVLEKKIQRDIEAAIGSEPDFLLLRNSVGQAQYVNDDGKTFFVPYGLGVGSPDLVGALQIPASALARRANTVALFVALEVKAPEGVVEPEQKTCHDIWRSFGVLVYVVRSVDDARNALDDARAIGRGWKVAS